jgi:excisionase family DNA binding protein
MRTDFLFMGLDPRGAIPMRTVEVALEELRAQEINLRDAGANAAADMVEMARDRLATLAQESRGRLNTASAREAAQRIGVSDRTIIRWIGRGRLEGRKLGGEYVIPSHALDQFLDHQSGG